MVTRDESDLREILGEETHRDLESFPEEMASFRAEMRRGFHALQEQLEEGFRAQTQAIRKVTVRLDRLETPRG